MKLTPVFAPILIAILSSCSPAPKLSADIATPLKSSLVQANLNDVTVSQDRTKGVVTLGGHVPLESDKENAGSIAKSLAVEQVIANQIEVIPVVAAAEAKSINSDLDNGIESNLRAALTKQMLHKSVNFSVKNKVVTLTGTVASQSMREKASKVAEAIANVSQVVNELQVEGQKATSSN
jgi:hyperosmotically inducible periplasmic protein